MIFLVSCSYYIDLFYYSLVKLSYNYLIFIVQRYIAID